MKNLLMLYIILIVLAVTYLFAIEGVGGGSFYVHCGGRDLNFTFYDVTVILVFLVSSALSIISLMAYSKKKSNRLLLVSFAFFLFALKSVLKLIDNFLLGQYSYIGISIQTLELLILLSLFYALFRK